MALRGEQGWKPEEQASQARSNHKLLTTHTAVCVARAVLFGESGLAYLPANPCLGGSVEGAECCGSGAEAGRH